MKKIQDMAGIEDSQIHYEGAGIIGAHTLCGITDIIDAEFEEVSKRVNCRACIGVRDHVLGRVK